MADKTKHVPVSMPENEVTLQSCATEFFRWVRKGIDLAEETPDFLKSCADDLGKAWDESAKR